MDTLINGMTKVVRNKNGNTTKDNGLITSGRNKYSNPNVNVGIIIG